MKNIVLATAAAIIFAPTLALANENPHNKSNSVQYIGPVEVSTLDTLLTDSGMFTEKDVVVEGHLLRQIKSDTYIFSDGKGEIQVELDDDIRLAQPIDEKTKVRLYGEYEGGKTPEIEVDQLLIL
ncbi:hypothetical protein TW81_05865 [Vibrio galatheae]|uniref:Uncharacterized protein n=1 Tax=Vibrio galatheae TaxID=579748 RepID=A0A0F4NLW6_9VIBR|nr:NirD/YgiW/YdeI family stress tolerance protein [Vibrio galatheae]KJY83853.1 hypothetical protein TW81_05865 [Vibrio galatheae]